MTAQAGKLCGYGRLAWPRLAATLHAAHGVAWADYHGFHIGTAPAEPPPYSHLWAWTAGWLLRARLDGTQAIVGGLQLDAVGPGLTVVESWDVQCEVRTAHNWSAAAKRVGPLGPEVAGRTVELYEVPGERPITFVRVR
jgi:hypothetical protein